MPSYDLVCQSCGHKFSIFCTISQKDQQSCPICGGDQIKQRFTTVNVMGSSGDKGSQGAPNSAPRGFG
ncbi:FmdB family zinc ribbon protein [Desulfosporosinus lacus]|uniref:Putative regulatory protein, FmdB family n=1 Tax=Desulfosporosinus lacus DSM 15449 TaxID=1121420 RepID=A0A1M6BNX8_9FIRM|nr:zinc ribbon domain-containing protein [Desulfosporosinus lacus]SHI50253.1 putative regulatory protein, FmdB family [Desulfosporosinus lacus DSM 15449]